MMKGQYHFVSLVAALLTSVTSAFVVSNKNILLPSSSLFASDTTGDNVVSIDVSDLGLTMSDLEKEIPINNFSVESSGYQSTSRIPGKSTFVLTG